MASMRDFECDMTFIIDAKHDAVRPADRAAGEHCKAKQKTDEGSKCHLNFGRLRPATMLLPPDSAVKRDPDKRVTGSVGDR